MTYELNIEKDIGLVIIYDKSKILIKTEKHSRVHCMALPSIPNPEHEIEIESLWQKQRRRHPSEESTGIREEHKRQSSRCFRATH